MKKFLPAAGALTLLAACGPATDAATDAGEAGAGMPLAAVEALYPGAIRKPNAYTAPLEDLVVDLGDGVKAVFEQDEAGEV